MKTIARTFSMGVLVACLLTPVYSVAQQSESQDTRTALKLQAGRAQHINARGKKAFYTREFELGGLPHYQPRERVSGELRIYGDNYIETGNLAAYWEEGFRKFEPEITFKLVVPTAVVAFPGLYFHLADIGMDHKPIFYDVLGYERTLNRDPLEVTAVTGSYDVPGWANSFAIVVNKANPLTRITTDQLDGIFGAARDGGWIGTAWHREFHRGPEKNLRTWGQLGLSGKWADQRINVYGYSLRYNTSTDFSDRILQGSDKWNEDIHVFANYLKPDGTFYIEADQIMDAVNADPYGIAYINFRADYPQTKRLAVAAHEGAPYVEHTIETVQNRTYPLYKEVYFYIDVEPGKPMDPKVKEFVRYVLSQEGQEAVERDGKYLPLTAEVVREQLNKLR